MDLSNNLWLCPNTLLDLILGLDKGLVFKRNELKIQVYVKCIIVNLNCTPLLDFIFDAKVYMSFQFSRKKSFVQFKNLSIQFRNISIC